MLDKKSNTYIQRVQRRHCCYLVEIIFSFAIVSIFVMLPEKSSSVLNLSQDFTTSLLESKRKYEATIIEKQQRIQDCLEAIGELISLEAEDLSAIVDKVSEEAQNW